jgi:hypothetical protein
MSDYFDELIRVAPLLNAAIAALRCPDACLPNLPQIDRIWSKLDMPADEPLVRMAMKFAEGEAYGVITDNPERVQRLLVFAKYANATLCNC